METGGRLADQPSDVGGAARGLQPLRRTHREAAFIDEEPEAERLGDDQRGNDQEDELATQTARKISHQVRSLTSVARQ